MSKKTEAPKEGIFLRKSAKGFNALLKQNQYKLALLSGYNAKQNVHTGLRAMRNMLNDAYDPVTNKFTVIDLTLKPLKKAK